MALGNRTLTLGDTNNTVFGGAINGTGGGITKVSIRNLSFVGAGLNTYTGTTIISEGSLQAEGGTNSFPPNSAVVIANAANTNLVRIPPHDQTIASLAGGGASGGNVLIGNNSTLIVGDSSSTIFAGNITGR